MAVPLWVRAPEAGPSSHDILLYYDTVIGGSTYMPYNSFNILYIVTTQPNINLTQLRLRLDIIIKPNPPHPTYTNYPSYGLVISNCIL